jgi:methylmalonyl-CoA mutase
MNKIKIVTAAALFDGHDVSINIFSKLMHKRGAEVVHIGHNRSVDEIITVALQEDVDAILVSSYQGGHNEFFKYLIDSLNKLSAKNIMVFGGGGGVILPSEISELETYGVTRIYHAIDGQNLGIHGIANDIIRKVTEAKQNNKKEYVETITENEIETNTVHDHLKIAKQITFIEDNINNLEKLNKVRTCYQKNDKKRSIVFGVTGTGGCGKSSLIDEIINRFLKITEDIYIGVLAVDPSKKLSGGAFLGDRIRYNNIYDPRVYFRSFATRESSIEISMAISDSINVLKSCGFDLIFVETSGIGQGNSQITNVSDHSIYVMTADYGSPSQLEKIDMLEMADYIVINKFEKIGSEDTFQHITNYYIKNNNIKVSHLKSIFELDLPIYGTSSNQYNNHGINKLFKDLLKVLKEKNLRKFQIKNNLLNLLSTETKFDFGLINNRRVNYLTEIADTIKQYYKSSSIQAELAGECFALQKSIKQFMSDELIETSLKKKFDEKWEGLSEETRSFLKSWEGLKKNYDKNTIDYRFHEGEFDISLKTKTLSLLKIPKVALPKYHSWTELVTFFYKENLPGYFPFTAGVFPFKRITEEPKRQFAGEGSPERTNRRFHYLSRNDTAKRLSTAFDGITLYGEDADEKPDIYGKIGESGVSICTIEDIDKLFEGFNLIDAYTSVSMTINAPAPIILAMYFMVAYQRELKKLEKDGKFLNENEELKLSTFRNLRGTVQADILKEDQGQNTCIFSIDFAMRLLGDVQVYFSKNDIKTYYSLSISGYHIAEAGANPITQLAFTLANGFTYVEYFLNRGLHIDEFAPNLSFFFSNGMEPEYSVIGRVARRIWAIAMKYKYGANDKSQKLKYHIQTSGRSLHAQEIDFNDIRTTLQALLAFYDNCNSLHTNSYDEAITTPTEESVRRSMAIQLILSNEFGMIKNENPNQGSFIIEELTDLVEEAVLEEFYRLSRRGGVLGAMETQYQRSKIQEESLYYEELKQSGEYPIIGVNKFLRENPENFYDNIKITRTTNEEKNERLQQLRTFQARNKEKAEIALERLKEFTLSDGNIFEELLNTVQYASLGQITKVLYEVGGKYRRGF